jgi:hypothetical protein
MTGPASLPNLFLSLEMPGVGIFERLASMTHGWPGEDLESRMRDEDPETMRRLLEVCERWHHMRMVDTPCSLDRLDEPIGGARALRSSPLRLVTSDLRGAGEPYALDVALRARLHRSDRAQELGEATPRGAPGALPALAGPGGPGARR